MANSVMFVFPARSVDKLPACDDVMVSAMAAVGSAAAATAERISN
jgi:hypothetical protein